MIRPAYCISAIVWPTEIRANVPDPWVREARLCIVDRRANICAEIEQALDQISPYESGSAGHEYISVYKHFCALLADRVPLSNGQPNSLGRPHSMNFPASSRCETMGFLIGHHMPHPGSFQMIVNCPFGL